MSLSLSETVSHQSAMIDSLNNLLNADVQGEEAFGTNRFRIVVNEVKCLWALLCSMTKMGEF